MFQDSMLQSVCLKLSFTSTALNLKFILLFPCGKVKCFLAQFLPTNLAMQDNENVRETEINELSFASALS